MTTNPTPPAGHDDTWAVTVEIPMRLPDDVKDSLFTAIADAAHDWEPAERDGWDIDVTGGPSPADDEPAPRTGSSENLSDSAGSALPADLESAPGGEVSDLRERIADTIRNRVRISPGPNALAELNAGQSIAISGGEADDAALAAMEVVRPEIDRAWEFAERVTETHMRFGVLGQPGARCADWCHLCRVERAEAAIARVRERLDWLIANGFGATGDTLRDLRAALGQPAESGSASGAQTEPNTPGET